MGSTPTRLATFFCEIEHEIFFYGHSVFYGQSLPSADSKRQLSVSGERMCTILVNCLND